MKTVVLHPPRWGRDRTVQVVARPLSRHDAGTIVDELSYAGINVRVYLGAVVHLYPMTELTTAQEVAVLRAFAAVTDAPLHWHPAVTP